MMRRIVPSLVVLILVLLISGCGKAVDKNAKTEKQEIKTYKVTTAELLSYVEATGSIQPDIEGTSRILPYLAGAVSKIFVKVGDKVKKGDPLISITSPDVTDTYSNYLSTLTQSKQAERIYNLNKQLFEIGAVTKNDLLNSESNYKQLNAIADGLKSKLSIYGFSADNDAAGLKQNRMDTMMIKAPMNGYIADIQTHTGDKVDASTPLITMADPNNIMVVANIYDTDIQKVKRGSNVTFYVDAFPDVAFKGIVTYVSDVSDVDLKTVKTYIRIMDKKNLFKHNMFLQLKIEGEKRQLSLIPQSAMVYKEGKFYVYRPDKDGRNNLKEIKPVKEVPGKLMAVEGVAEGEEIVLTAIELEKP
ncbi:MAG: efflux RND transporter periplasmic adaptor subunit [Deltaproteobacteria bacterium]